ncbi:hypothetical protein RJT34_05725 [Clitoria ternatea]|uniref:Uncharacterized protein n=1 Tax=Clitoria ternatea TaxID=43366 RepID=A0AAN9K3B0_CLITE
MCYWVHTWRRNLYGGLASICAFVSDFTHFFILIYFFLFFLLEVPYIPLHVMLRGNVSLVLQHLLPCREPVSNFIQC